jgi:RNA polymerase sigma-70 factor (ECF subfamily)
MFRNSRTEKPQLDFEALYCANSEEIFRFCLRMTGNRAEAEDLTQEVFVAALEGLHRFRNQASQRTWLYRIAIYRHRANRKRFESRNVSLGVEHEANNRDQSDLHVARIALRDAIRELPEPLREAFVLVKCEGLTCSEAASILHIPVGTLKFRIHRAVDRLQTILGDEVEESNAL